jgi:glycosyltransferase involved in cell wall biosynthesis
MLPRRTRTSGYSFSQLQRGPAEGARAVTAGVSGIKSGQFVLVLCLERFWPAHGGVERYALEIARWFRDICPVVILTAVRQNRPLREDLLSRRGSLAEFAAEPAGIPVFTAGLGPMARIWFQGITLLESFAHRVASARYYQTRGLVMQETSRLLARNVSRILDVGPSGELVLHAMGPWELSHVGDRLFPNAARVATPFIHPGHWGEDKLSRSWFRSRDRLIALGDEDARVCRDTGIPSDRVTVVPLFAPAIVEEVVTRHDRRTVVFLGIARPYKGVDIFLEAAKILRAERNDLEFIWAGSIPPESKHLLVMAREAGVQVRGPVSEREKLDMLQVTLCLCLPSATEITPYSILEAWAAGAPVVATDNAYFREFIGGGGELVPRVPDEFAAAIRKLAEQSALAEQQVRVGRSYLQGRHDPSIVGPRLALVYQQAIARRRASRL